MTTTSAGFEGLLVWQAARRLCSQILSIILTAREARDWPLADQLNRAAISTIANVAEGYLRRRRREFMQFVRVAAGSNAEVRACLYVALDRGYLQPAAFAALVEDTNAIGRMLEGLLRKLEREALVKCGVSVLIVAAVMLWL
jgi:four helix bundle protein